MDELVLVRHTETAWSGWRYCGRTDLPLTPAGEGAAEALGRHLAATVPADVRIVSSPLLRARQTASAIAQTIGSHGFTVDDRWAETDFGTVEGLTFEELEVAHPRIASRLAVGEALIDWPDGETALALQARVEAAWREATGQPGSWVVVSHGGPLRIAIALAMDVDPAQVTVPPPGTVWRRHRASLLAPASLGRPLD